MERRQVDLSSTHRRNIHDIYKEINAILMGIVPYEMLLRIVFNLIFFRMIFPDKGGDSRKVFFFGKLKLPEGLIFNDFPRKNVKQNIIKANAELEKLNPHIFKGFLNSINYNEHKMLTNPILEKILNELGKLGLLNISNDIIYSAFVRVFTDGIFKYNRKLTPEQVNSLVVRFIDKEVHTIYDPAFGHGNSLIKTLKYQKDFFYNEDVHLFGTEFDKIIYSIGKIQFLMKGVFNGDIREGNSLLEPQFIKQKTDKDKKEKNALMTFDIVISHLPFEIQKKEISRKLLKLYKDFKYGFPRNVSKEFLLFLHSIASLNENGKAILIIPKRIPNNDTELSILKAIINDDLIEGVLYLGRSYTIIESQLIIINKKKAKENKGRIIFYDITDTFPEPRHLYREKVNINSVSDKILDNYSHIIESNKLKSVSLDGLRINNFSLDCNEYFREQKEFEDIKELEKKLTLIDEELEIVKKEREKILKEILDNEK
ncbi:SAM-dependent DNA methyltransferase [bacterium]|nr:SAM-dependent DNA methyltransferase [bacterium]